VDNDKEGWVGWEDCGGWECKGSMRRAGRMKGWEGLEDGKDWRMGRIGGWEGLEDGKDWRMGCKL
jgi:hypothetical protein